MTYHSDEPLRLAGGLACFTVLKLRLSSGDEAIVSAACQNLCDECTAGAQDFGGEQGGGFDQRHGSQMIGLFMANRIGGHIRHDEIGFPTQRFGQDVWRGIVRESPSRRS